jgi:hypothetical protein
MKPIKNGFIAVTLLTVASIAPVIPAELELLYSYQYDPTLPTETAEGSATTSTIAEKERITDYQDTDGNNLISVSVFADQKGNLVYTQIDDKVYEDMGKVNGVASNPKKDELVSAFDLLTTPVEVEAAIAFDSGSSAFSNSATSITWAHTTAGTNRILWVGAMSLNARSISSTTYNGIDLTPLTRSPGSASAQPVQLWYLIAPATGSNNIVMTLNAGGNSFIYGAAASYTGVEQANQPDAQNTNSTTALSVTTSVTVVDLNSWVVLVARNSDSGDTNAGTNSTERVANTGYIQMYDSNAGISPGSFSMTVTNGGVHITTIAMASFSPALPALQQATVNGGINISGGAAIR